MARIEKIQFKFQMNKKQYESYGNIFCGVLNVTERDTVNIRWDLWVDYLNDVDKKLKALLELKRSGVIINSNWVEVNHGVCLIEQVLKELKDVRST